MAGNESQVLGTELERVAPKVELMFEREDTFFSQVEKRPIDVISSRDMRIPLEIRPGGKSGYYNPDGGDLGRGDMSTFDKAIINSVHMRHAVEITAKATWSTDSTRKSVINAFRQNFASQMAEFRRFIDSQCMQDGTGTLATVTSVTVNTPVGYDTITCTTDGFGVKLLRFGMNINVFNSALTVCRTAGGPGNELPITFLDLPNKQFQIPTGSGIVATDLIVASGLQSTPPTGFLGIKYHNSNASSGTWLGFDRGLNPEIRANRVNGNSSALTLPLPRLAINKIGDRLGKKVRNKLQAWTHPAQEQAYEELGMNVIRIDKTAAKEQGLNMYFNDNMQMAGAPLNTSYSWDRTRIDFITMEKLGRAELHPVGLYSNPERSNDTTFEVRGQSGGVVTAWLFYIVSSMNLFASNPAALSYVDALAVPAGY